MKRRKKARCRTTLDQFFSRAEDLASIDARPAIQSPSYRLRPRKGARACLLCTRLIAPGARPPDCLIASCPRELIPVPTNPVAWQAFVEAADQY